MNDLDMVGAMLLLFDHDSQSNSSCSEEDYLEALASYSNTRDIELSLEIHLKLSITGPNELYAAYHEMHMQAHFIFTAVHELRSDRYR